MSARTSPSATTLRGYWLILARVLWVGLAAVTLGAFAFSVPVRYSQLSHPSASVRAALEEMGLSPDGYALYNVGLDAAFISVFAVVAIVIFLRRSGDPVALLVATMLVLWGTWNDLFVATPRAIEGLHPLLDAAVALLSYAGYMAWMLFFLPLPERTLRASLDALVCSVLGPVLGLVALPAFRPSHVADRSLQCGCHRSVGQLPGGPGLPLRASPTPPSVGRPSGWCSG
jgi:hypothetical protein